MIEACEAAQIWDLISALPGGPDTVAGDRGYRLSGGEKQRVALARLLLKAPTVVILDEATATLRVRPEGTAFLECGSQPETRGRFALTLRS